MKAFLMFKDQDFQLQQPLPANEKALIQDLELNTLFQAMSLGDPFLLSVAKQAVLSSLVDPDAIRYRQDILRDCLKNPAVVREIYQIPIDAMENKRRQWMGIFSRYPSGILDNSIQLMELFVETLRKLRTIAETHASSFESEGFTRFFAMIQAELDDEYFAIVEDHLRELKFKDGVLISASLGKGNEGTNYVLRKPLEKTSGWIKSLFTRKEPSHVFYIHERDEHGARALSDLRDRGINLAANALAQSADHIDNFLNMLRVELAFYIGCLNLHDQLSRMENPLCFPTPAPANERRHTSQGLYDICLALTMKQKIVGNELRADFKNLVMITGANQGGKSTFLRSIGLSQLMMQCGMFVAAEAFHANIAAGIFTHYRRKEDASMKSGKLDEELGRMSSIVDALSPHSLVLFNESFAATNEREGSEIARQITTALLDMHIKVFFVTHMYEFAHTCYEKKQDDALFLKAERKAGGRRTYKLVLGEPSQTSHGEDVYQVVFGRKE
ncbi:MAG TPA: hypothetical protein PLV24_12275 [Anaerolineaceae bacterium]|nr:hypothetical protein [Anaerolineaceae bacterium]